ncbi:MAG: hypothetical protein PUF39_02940 [Prevotellaceae bacterium]|nr:hypothetical protein [Prevotellaceae bacterium]
MDIIKRNFFCLLRTGALNDFTTLEPMSPYKWRLVMGMAQQYQVEGAVLKGVKSHQYDRGIDFPNELFKLADFTQGEDQAEAWNLSNRWLNKRLRQIRMKEPCSSNPSMETIGLLNLLVKGTREILKGASMVSHTVALGQYLRRQNDRINKEKLAAWVGKTHLQGMVQLQMRMLVEFLDFQAEELPLPLPMRKRDIKRIAQQLNQPITGKEGDLHFWQDNNGLVRNNTQALRRNLQRALRLLPYASLETLSYFSHRFILSLNELEE